MSSKRTILSRPRTRLYDSNYNIGESYYKPALDRLDRKYSGRPLSPVRNPTPFSDISDRHARTFADEDLDTVRRRAASTIREEHQFDSRGGRITRAQALANHIEQDMDEEAMSSSRTRRAKMLSAADDVDMESTSNNLKTHRMLDRSEKLLDTVGINDTYSRRRMLAEVTDEEMKPRRRVFKEPENHVKFAVPIENGIRASRRVDEAESNVQASVKTMRMKNASLEIKSDETSAAAMRARQTKEKINDIEEEMQAMAEKQAAREARVARLRALVAETEMESAELEKQQAKIERAQARKTEQLG